LEIRKWGWKSTWFISRVDGLARTYFQNSYFGIKPADGLACLNMMVVSSSLIYLMSMAETIVAVLNLLILDYIP
jgi:hypothetical protein